MLGKTRYPATFYQSSLEQGVQQVEVLFEIAAEYVPAANTISTDKLVQLAGLDAPVDAAFDSIVTQSERMLALKSQAQILATKQVPVLIYGETGTGKELFARAIHNAGPRPAAPFVAVNCGAIVPELIDSTLFGLKKGAFTGAIADRPGVFQQAHGGTLFLDEFGELTPDVQVRLLRVLQEGTFTPVGSSQELKVDVRLITATHRNLMQEVAHGRFREDLFYRIAVGVLHLPPLREREGDLLLLSEKLLAGIASQDASLGDKKISAEAKNLILQYPWRGNVRELQSTLLRAALWCSGDLIGLLGLCALQNLVNGVDRQPVLSGQLRMIGAVEAINDGLAPLGVPVLHVLRHSDVLPTPVLGQVIDHVVSRPDQVAPLFQTAPQFGSPPGATPATPSKPQIRTSRDFRRGKNTAGTPSATLAQTSTGVPLHGKENRDGQRAKRRPGRAWPALHRATSPHD